MAEDGQLGGFARGAEPTVTDLLDPIALEARLKEARARRAEALARREVGRPPDPEASAGAPVRGARVPFAPRSPGWLDDPEGAAPEPEPLPEPAPAARLRPVLLVPEASPARAATAPGEHPPLVAPALPATDAEDRILGAPRPPAARRRLPPAALLFLAGLGLGAAAVALAVRPSSESPATVANSPAPSGEAPATATPAVGDAPPAVIATLPAPPDPAARTPRPPVVAETTPPADLAPPAAEPAPPPMAPPDPTIGALIASATPEPRPEPAAPEAAAPESPQPVTPEAAAPEAAAPATPLPQRVSIHYPRSAQALAASVQATLRAAGVADVETMPVGFAIGRSNVRFYHDSDRAAAEGASALLAGALDGAPEARDFTDYPTPTATGRVEIWLAGEPGRSAAAREPRATPAKPAPAPVVAAEAPDPYAPVLPRDQVREVQRILLDRLQGN